MKLSNKRNPISCCSSTTALILVSFFIFGAWTIASKASIPLRFSYDTDSWLSKERRSVDYGTAESNFLSDEMVTAQSLPKSLSEEKEKSEDEKMSDRKVGENKLEVGDSNAGSELKEDNTFEELSKEAEKDELQQYSNKKDREGNHEIDAVGKDSVKNTVDAENKLVQAEQEANISEEYGKVLKETGASAQKILSDEPSSLSLGQLIPSWKLCNTNAGADYIPCLDNMQAIKKLQSTSHYEHRERHCPEEPPTCLVALPVGYRQPIKWPTSRNKIWYSNVPSTQLAKFKGHQNWIKVSGDYLTFPGGGTQFKHGALHYIDFIAQAKKDIAWGERTRVVLDVGCGVASFGGYLFDRNVIAMSFAPKDEHEAQVQFALERGIPAISAVMGTTRLPFPSKVFDLIHCARCRVPWHIEGGKLLLELNRLLRPGGYFVWSATPVYQKLPEDVEIWHEMSTLTKSMCWTLVNKVKDRVNSVGVAIFRKPFDNNCYANRKENSPPLCNESDNPDAAWGIKLVACMHKLPTNPAAWGTQWPELWPLRLEKAPYWLNSSVIGVYGKSLPDDFHSDYIHWKRIISDSYKSGLGIDWSDVRNVMDMRSVYGGFAAALQDMPLWVMNVVPVDSADTLPIIFERGLFGIYHDWCESFSTYPRTYDLLHADHLFSLLKNRCKLLPVIAEVDRILRPRGKMIVRDDKETIGELFKLATSLHWDILTMYSKDQEGVLCIQKTIWRPDDFEPSM